MLGLGINELELIVLQQFDRSRDFNATGVEIRCVSQCLLRHSPSK